MAGLQLLDVLLILIHFLVIGFNLFGWIFKRTRKLHFVVVCGTAACWFILGIWFGIGYCPITDWDWRLKTMMGEHDLPHSFIKYYADKLTGRSINADLIDTLTSVSFFCAALLSVYLNFIKKRRMNESGGRPAPAK